MALACTSQWGIRSKLMGLHTNCDSVKKDVGIGDSLDDNDYLCKINIAINKNEHKIR